MTNDKKSFKKYASKHLAKHIEHRRATKKSRDEKKERLERKEKRETREREKEETEHRRDLDKLKDQDPEFYSYLEQDDPSLLQFGEMDESTQLVDEEDGSDAETDEDLSDGELPVEEDGEEDEEDEEVEGDDIDDELEEGEEDDEDDEAVAQDAKAGTRVTKAEIDEATKGKKVLDAVNLMTSAVRQLGIQLHESRHANSTRKFEEPTLVKYAIAQGAKLTAAQLPSLLVAGGKTPAFKDLPSRALVKRVLNATVAVLTENSTDGTLCAQLAQSLSTLVKIMHLIRGVTKAVLRAVLNLCTHQDETARMAAYMVALSIAKRSSGTRSMYQSAVFKGVFLSLVRTSHKYNVHTLPVIGFLMSSVVNLFGTDIEAAYQHAYVYVRQLAVHLRSALQEQSQHNIRAIFNWQFLNALRCWGLVVSTHHGPQQLGPLIHPVVQIATGLLDLFSSPRMFPMHLQVIEMLNHISTRSGVYIPVSTYVLRILSSPSSALETGAMPTGSKAGSAADAVDLQFSMRVKKAQARSNVYKVQLWTEALYLLVEHLAAHSHTIGFPETFWAVASTLTKLKREVKMPKVHNQLSTILGHMAKTVAVVKAKREQSSFGPCDVESVKMFEDEMKTQGTPLVAYYNQMRQQRVAGFAAKQKNVDERRTLEGAVEERTGRPQRPHHAGQKRSRSNMS